MFKFTIRELLHLTVIAALGVGWVLREQQLRSDLAARTEEGRLWRRRCERMAEEFVRVGGRVMWDEHSITTHIATESLESRTTVGTDD